jgi:hypothetical protein
MYDILSSSNEGRNLIKKKAKVETKKTKNFQKKRLTKKTAYGTIKPSKERRYNNERIQNQQYA